MLTVLEAIKSSTEYLEKKGISSPRLNSELLLSHALNCKRFDLYLSFERPLQKTEIDFYRELLRRRSKFEPLQYIIGKVEFFGLEFEVNSSVLIPRPETELLVEAVLGSIKKDEQVRILDIGCGSGNISIALAKNIYNCKVIGVDISEAALEIAQRNAELNRVEKQIKFFIKNILEEMDVSEHRFDVIVSNPPYVSADEFSKLEPELRLYEPQIALTDGGDGLLYFKKISSLASALLKEKGKVFFEIGAGQAAAVQNILIENQFCNIVIEKDYSDIERIIIGEKF